jgi:transcriptional regulator GlxA family with amidase domain
VVDEAVVLDDRIISCGGPGAALDMAFLLMECLMGSETTQKVRKYMMYQ